MTPWLWFGIGLALIVSEFFVPGLVIGFFGAAALVVAAALGLGLIESLGASLGLWMVSALAMVLGLRRLLIRYVPSDRVRRSIDEDVAAFGTEVQVLEEVVADKLVGRIRFQGTSWPATCVEGRIPAGSTARLIVKEGIGWVVEPSYGVELEGVVAQAAARRQGQEED